MVGCGREIQHVVRSIVAELAGISAGEVKESDRLQEDLGLDSMQRMELLARVADEFGVQPTLQEVMNVTTIEEVVAALERVVGRAAASA